jgi:hypothetical protein
VESCAKWQNNFKFSKEEKDLTLGENAQQLFKFPSDFRKTPKLTNIDGLKE